MPSSCGARSSQNVLAPYCSLGGIRLVIGLLVVCSVPAGAQLGTEPFIGLSAGPPTPMAELSEWAAAGGIRLVMPRARAFRLVGEASYAHAFAVGDCCGPGDPGITYDEQAISVALGFEHRPAGDAVDSGPDAPATPWVSGLRLVLGGGLELVWHRAIRHGSIEGFEPPPTRWHRQRLFVYGEAGMEYHLGRRLRARASARLRVIPSGLVIGAGGVEPSIFLGLIRPLP